MSLTAALPRRGSLTSVWQESAQPGPLRSCPGAGGMGRGHGRGEWRGPERASALHQGAGCMARVRRRKRRRKAWWVGAVSSVGFGKWELGAGAFFPCFVQPHCTGGGCPPNLVSAGGRRTCSCPSLESWCAEIRQFPLHPPGQQGKGGSGGLTSGRVRSPDQECGLGATNPSLTHFHQMPGAVADLG